MLLPTGSLATPRSGRVAADLVENQRNPAVEQQHVHQDWGMLRALLLPSARSIVFSALDFHIILKSVAHKTKYFSALYLFACRSSTCWTNLGPIRDHDLACLDTQIFHIWFFNLLLVRLQVVVPFIFCIRFFNYQKQMQFLVTSISWIPSISPHQIWSSISIILPLLVRSTYFIRIPFLYLPQKLNKNWTLNFWQNNTKLVNH